MFRQSAPLPPPAALAFQQAPGAPSVGGLDGGARVAWLVVGVDLHVWRCDGSAPSGHACVRLPRTATTAAASQPPLVAAVLTGSRGGEDNIFLVAALPDTGALVSWPRASSAGSAPAQGLQYLPSTPTSLVARPGRAGGVLALVGCTDGSVCRVDVSPDGSATVTTCTRPWEEGGAADAQAGPGGAQQLLGRATRGALSLLRASGRPLPRASVQSLAWSDAPELQTPGHACALVLTEYALEAVSLPLAPSAGEDGNAFTFSRGALATAQAALRDTGARVLAFGPVVQGGVVLLAATAGSRRSAPHALWLLHCATEAQPPHGGLTLLRAPVALTVDASDAVRVTVPGGVSCCAGARHVMIANSAANTAAVVSAVDGSLVVPFTGACVLAGAWAQDGDGRLLTSAGVLHWLPSPLAVPPSPLTRAPRGRDGGTAPPSGAGEATGAVLEAFHSGTANLDALQADGCFDVGDNSPLVDAMRRVLNTLPKRWGDASADNEVAHAATVLQQLGDKAASLGAFLEWAAGTGVWQRCTPPTKAAMLTCVEQLSGVLRLRRFCNDLLPGSPGSGALRDALAAAGTAIPGGPDTAPRHAVDGVFEQPSHVEGFFTAAAQALESMTQRAAGHGQDGEAQDAHTLWAAASALCGAILEVLLGAREARSAQAARYPPASEAPLRWTASAAIIAALKAAAAAAVGCAAASELAQQALLDITTYLLDAAAAARDSEAPGTAARVQLHGQYAQLRDWMLPALLAAAVGGREQVAPGREKAPALSMDAVAQLAAQHGAHTTMYAVCAVTGEWDRLLDWMRQLPGGGPDGEPSFSGAVFACMLDDGRVHHLLDGLPDEWNPQLRGFLELTPHLGWMHALRCGDYPAAAELLMRVGTAPGRQPGAVGALDALHLAKLAHMAAGASDDDPPVVAADAACELHALQAAAAGDATHPMPPGALAEALLNAAQMEPAQRPLAAMRVFLASSASTRAQHAALIHRVWVEAARQTDWAAVGESKGQLSDDAYVDALAQTPLAQLADACFAPDRLVMEPPFAWGGEVGGELEVGEALQQELGAGSEAMRDALRVGAAGWEIRMVDGLGDMA